VTSWLISSLDLITMIGTSDRLCWLAETCKIPSLEGLWIYGLRSKYAVPYLPPGVHYLAPKPDEVSAKFPLHVTTACRRICRLQTCQPQTRQLQAHTISTRSCPPQAPMQHKESPIGRQLSCGSLQIAAGAKGVLMKRLDGPRRELIGRGVGRI